MKRKLRIFSNIAIICLSVCMFAFGVYAASTVSVTTSGTVTFEATGVFAEVTRTITGAKNTPASTTVSIDASASENAEYPMNADLEFEDGDTLLTISFEIENKATDRCIYATMQNGDSAMVNNNVEQVAEYLNTEIMISANSSKVINIYLFVKDSNKSATATYDYKILLKSTTAGTVLTENDVELETNYDGTATLTKITSTASHITIPEKIGDYTITKIRTSSSSYNIFGEEYYGSSKNTTLQHITMSNNIEIVDGYSESAPLFAGCTSLKYIAIPESWGCIPQYAFDDTIIEVLVLPEIGEIHAYSLGSTTLDYLIIPSTVQYISDSPIRYDYCNVTSVIYQGDASAWASIGEPSDGNGSDGGYPMFGGYLFCNGIKATNITVSATEVRPYAFYGFEIDSLVFEEGVEILREYSIVSAKLITLPISLKFVGECALYYNTYEVINYAGTIEQFLEIQAFHTDVENDEKVPLLFGDTFSLNTIHCSDGDITQELRDELYNEWQESQN